MPCSDGLAADKAFDAMASRRLDYVTALLCDLCEKCNLDRKVTLPPAFSGWYEAHKRLDVLKGVASPGNAEERFDLEQRLQRFADYFAKFGKFPNP